MPHGGIDVAIWIFTKQIPEGRTVGIFKGHFALGAGGVEQERENGVLADVFSDVLLRVIRPHLFLVDVFLEDVTKDIGIDLVVGAERAFIKMPLVLIKIIENALKGFVGNMDVLAVAVGLFKFMHVEQAAVEIWMLPSSFSKSGARSLRRLPKPSWNRRSRK